MSSYQLVREAVVNKRIVTGVYKGYSREMCPHVIGWSAQGIEMALFYQFAGESKSGLGPAGSADNWRCIVLSELTNVKVRDGEWETAPKAPEYNKVISPRPVVHLDE
jgi:hypothetical protein